MPSVISHAVAGSALSAVFGRNRKKLLLIAALSAMVPDADALGFFAGVPYDSLFGHRGFTHSFAFAALWSGMMTFTFFRGPGTRGRALVVLFLATASHPLLDMLTNGGLGVALFSPFSTERFFFPWRPIRVSPISISGFFTDRGWQVFLSELEWVWTPALAIMGFGWIRSRRGARMERSA